MLEIVPQGVHERFKDQVGARYRRHGRSEAQLPQAVLLGVHERFKTQAGPIIAILSGKWDPTQIGLCIHRARSRLAEKTYVQMVEWLNGAYAKKKGEEAQRFAGIESIWRKDKKHNVLQELSPCKEKRIRSTTFCRKYGFTELLLADCYWHLC